MFLRGGQKRAFKNLIWGFVKAPTRLIEKAMDRFIDHCRPYFIEDISLNTVYSG